MNKSKAISQSNETNTTSSRYDNFIKNQLFKRFEQIKDSYLQIQDSESTYEFGDKKSELQAIITVTNNSFYKALAFQGSVGAAEQYMLNHWDSGNLTNLVRVFVRNQDILDGLEGGSAWIKNSLLKIAHYFNKNSEQGSKKNIAEHYDLGYDLFKLFLDKHMMYSSAVFKTPTDSLEMASENK
jgi:cyclopropane-fatty-acyl-phospholipid synthase